MREHLHELPPRRSVLDIIASALAKLDNIEWASPEDRARRFAAQLSLEGYQVLESIPLPRERAIR